MLAERHSLNALLENVPLDCGSMLVLLISLHKAALDLHCQGKVHGDIDHHDIMFIGTECILKDTTLSDKKITATALEYTAPEVFRNENITPAADYYSLALIAAEILNAQPSQAPDIYLQQIKQMRHAYIEFNEYLKNKGQRNPRLYSKHIDNILSAYKPLIKHFPLKVSMEHFETLKAFLNSKLPQTNTGAPLTDPNHPFSAMCFKIASAAYQQTLSENRHRPLLTHIDVGYLDSDTCFDDDEQSSLVNLLNQQTHPLPTARNDGATCLATLRKIMLHLHLRNDHRSTNEDITPQFRRISHLYDAVFKELLLYTTECLAQKTANDLRRLDATLASLLENSPDEDAEYLADMLDLPINIKIGSTQALITAIHLIISQYIELTNRLNKQKGGLSDEHFERLSALPKHCAASLSNLAIISDVYQDTLPRIFRAKSCSDIDFRLFKHSQKESEPAATTDHELRSQFHQ